MGPWSTGPDLVKFVPYIPGGGPPVMSVRGEAQETEAESSPKRVSGIVNIVLG